MSQTQQLIVLNVSMVVCSVIACIYFVKKDKLKRSGKAEIIKKRKLHNKYVFYNNNLLLRKRFRRIVMQFSSLSCYDFDKVKEESVKLFESSVIVAVLMPIASLIFLKDILLSLLVAFVGYIYYEIAVEKQIDKLYTEIIEECSMCIESIRERYMETDNIATAVLYSDKGKYLEKPVTQIYEILTDQDGEERLYEFCKMSPVRIIKTLATTCYIINENGDEKAEEGQSSFESMLTILRQEANTEIRRLVETRIAFKSLSKLALVGLICTPLADMFLLSQIPGTTVLIKGMYGAVEKTVVIGITIAAYYVISIFNRPSVVNQVDKIEWVDNLSKRKKVKNLIKNVIPKKFKTRRKLELLIKESISSKTLEYVYTTKVITSMAAFVTVLVFLMCFVITAKSFLWNNYGSLSFIPSTGKMTEAMYNQIAEVDKEYMTQPEKISDDEAYKIVKAKVRGLKELEVHNQVERLSLKWDKYYSLGFKWYFIVVAYGAAVIGWFSPEISLMLRHKLVKYEEGEDVMQLQTMMIVLSDTKMDVFRTLYWLEKQSTIHKAPLRFAYHEYSSNPEEALDRLESSVSSRDFKRLISKLKAAMYNLSLKDAFSDMKYDKEQTLIIRETLQKETLESKRQWARMIASAPAFMTVFLGFVGPILLLGISEILKTFATLV